MVVAPTLTYHFYPAFLEYPGSTSLLAGHRQGHDRRRRADADRATARAVSMSSTPASRPCARSTPAVALMASEGVLVRYTNLATRLDPATKGFVEQEGGTHADEVETSMMLYIDPSSVDMTQGGQGLHAVDRRRAPDAAARRHRHVFAYRHLGRSDARDAREGTSVRRSARRRHRRRHRRTEDGAAAGTHGRATAGARTGSAHGAASRARSRARPAGTLLGRRRAPDRGDRQLVFRPLEQSRLREAGGAVVAGRRYRPPRRRDRAWRAAHHHQSHATLRSARVSILASPVDPDQDPVPVGRHRRSPTANGNCAAFSTRPGRPLPTMEGLVTLVLKRTSGWLIEAYRYTITPAPAPRRQLRRCPSGPGGPGGLH